MKAIITNDKDSKSPGAGVSRLGLRLVSEGAHDVVLMEMLEEDYPSICRREREVDRDGTMDVTVPIQSTAGYPNNDDGVLLDSDVRLTRGAPTIVTEYSTPPSFIREPVVVIDDPGSWDFDHVEVNGRHQGRKVDGAGELDHVEDIPPGARVAVFVTYRGDDPNGELLRCKIVPASALARAADPDAETRGTRTQVVTLQAGSLRTLSGLEPESRGPRGPGHFKNELVCWISVRPDADGVIVEVWADDFGGVSSSTCASSAGDAILVLPTSGTQLGCFSLGSVTLRNTSDAAVTVTVEYREIEVTARAVVRGARVAGVTSAATVGDPRSTTTVVVAKTER